MKLESKIWKNRTIHLPNHSNTMFDENGICDIDITEEFADYLVKHIAELSIFEETKKKEKISNSKVLEGQGSFENQSQIDKNSIDVKKEIQMSDDQKQKNEAIEKISSIKNLKKLKELADNFEKEEWEQLKTVEDFKNYLISKI